MTSLSTLGIDSQGRFYLCYPLKLLAFLTGAFKKLMQGPDGFFRSRLGKEMTARKR